MSLSSSSIIHPLLTGLPRKSKTLKNSNSRPKVSRTHSRPARRSRHCTPARNWSPRKHVRYSPYPLQIGRQPPRNALFDFLWRARASRLTQLGPYLLRTAAEGSLTGPGLYIRRGHTETETRTHPGVSRRGGYRLHTRWGRLAAVVRLLVASIYCLRPRAARHPRRHCLPLRAPAARVRMRPEAR